MPGGGMYKGAGSRSEIPQEIERQAKQLTIGGRHLNGQLVVRW